MRNPMLCLPVLALAACAGKTPPPAIALDTAQFQPATLEAEPPRPVEIDEVPRPLPLPGQLLPPPTTRKDTSLPTARVEAANRAATREPSSAGYLNAVQVYPWTDGALYRLYAAPERVSDIALQPGEKLVAVSAGDTVRWVIGDTTSGAGDDARVHVLVKPFAAGLVTNMVITTDRRAYHLALESTDRTAMAAISWTYPQDRLVALRRQNARAEEARPVAENVALNNLRFRYAITGDNPPWRPLRAWDAGNKVYIEFPARLVSSEAPPLFVVGPLGQSQLVNYRVSGNHYIVDRLFGAAELRLGENPQGARLIGSYDSVVAFGQRRALLVWQRIILPDGSSIQIDNLPATDAAGYAGLADKVDFHTWQLLKGVTLSTLLGVGTELSLGSEESDLVRAIRQSTQQSAAQAGQQIVSKNLNIQPTITVRPGWPLRVIVHKDIVFPRPWGGAR